MMATLVDWALAGALSGRATTRQALAEAPAASVLLSVPVGVPEVGHAPLATEIVKGFVVEEPVAAAAIAAESTRGTSPVLVMVKVPVTELPGASVDQFNDCVPTVSAAVPALRVGSGVAVSEELR